MIRLAFVLLLLLLAVEVRAEGNGGTAGGTNTEAKPEAGAGGASSVAPAPSAAGVEQPRDAKPPAEPSGTEAQAEPPAESSPRDSAPPPSSDEAPSTPDVQTIVVVGPPGNTGRAASTVQRLQAELLASGFRVKLRRFRWYSLSAMVDDAVVSDDASAVITVTKGKDGTVVDVWIADRGGGKTVGRRVDGSSPAQLSVSAVEALRAGLLEASISPDPPEPMLDPEPIVEPPTEPEPMLEPATPEAKNWRLSTGAAVMVASESLGGSVGPQVRLARALAPGWWLGAQVIAPLWGAEQEGIPVDQVIVKAELSWTHHFADSMLVAPTIGAGFYWLGHAREEDIRADNDYAAIGSWGVGIGLDITEDAYILWDIDGMLFFPKPGVVARSRALARPGMPAFLSTLGLNLHF